MGSVVVVGSVNVDIITQVGSLPAPGETVLGRDALIRPGGKGANQAVAAARLGALTRMVGAVGADEFAGPMRDNLAAHGVDVRGVRPIEGAATGLALIVVAADGENTIVVASGANAALDSSHVAGLAIGPGDVLALQLEIPLDTALAAARSARAAGARVQLNAAPLGDPADPRLRALLEHTDVLVANETEAIRLDDTAFPSDVDGWVALAGRLPVPAGIITLGGRGAVAADGRQSWWQPPFPVEVVDTTGAGDAFCGTLAQSLAAGHDLPDAVRRSCAAGALATARLGAQSALPTVAELDARLGPGYATRV